MRVCDFAPVSKGNEETEEFVRVTAQVCSILTPSSYFEPPRSHPTVVTYIFELYGPVATVHDADSSKRGDQEVVGLHRQRESKQAKITTCRRGEERSVKKFGEFKVARAAFRITVGLSERLCTLQ